MHSLPFKEFMVQSSQGHGKVKKSLQNPVMKTMMEISLGAQS